VRPIPILLDDKNFVLAENQQSISVKVTPESIQQQHNPEIGMVTDTLHAPDCGTSSRHASSVMYALGVIITCDPSEAL
jgi:hypothetical protein